MLGLAETVTTPGDTKWAGCLLQLSATHGCRVCAQAGRVPHILYLFGILWLVQTYTVHNNVQDMAPLQRKQHHPSLQESLCSWDMCSHFKKSLDAFLGLFLNPYSLDIKGWFAIPIIFYLVLQHSEKMCSEVSNGLDTSELTVGTGVRESGCRQSSEPGLSTIEDCLIAKGKNTPKVSDVPLSISWKQMVEEFGINSPAAPSLAPAPCRDDQPLVLTACETALDPRGTVCAQEPPCK